MEWQIPDVLKAIQKNQCKYLTNAFKASSDSYTCATSSIMVASSVKFNGNPTKSSLKIWLKVDNHIFLEGIYNWQ